MDSKDIFTSALGLQSPWSVSRAEFQTNESGTKELHLWITFERGSIFTAPDGSQSTAYDTLDKTWRHLNFFQHHCYIHCNVPRIRYGKKQIAMVNVPWARPNSGFYPAIRSLLNVTYRGRDACFLCIKSYSSYSS